MQVEASRGRSEERQAAQGFRGCACERTSGAAHNIRLVCLESCLAHKLQAGREGRQGRERTQSMGSEVSNCIMTEEF